MYNLPIYVVDLAKEYQHSPRFKDAYLYIVKNYLPLLVPHQIRVKTNKINYSVSNKLLFSINARNVVIAKPIKTRESQVIV